MTPAHRRLAPAAALVLALLLGACGGDDEPTSTGTLELAPSTTSTTAPEDAALAAQVLTEVPLEGFVLADAIVGAGPMDLEAAAVAEPDPAAERALLEEAGFERGVSRAWVHTDQDVAYVALYRFDDAAGATAYRDASVERVRGLGATTFEVPDVEGATGFTTVEESPEAGGGATFTTHGVTFVRGDLTVLVLLASPTATATVSPEQAAAVAAEQAALLG